MTVNSLQVTCSKLGISLRRRPKLNPELNHAVPYTEGPISSPAKVNSVRFTFEQVDELLRGTLQNEIAASRPDDIEGQQVDGANLALTMHLRGLERTVPLRLSNEVIAALAVEAQLRQTSRVSSGRDRCKRRSDRPFRSMVSPQAWTRRSRPRVTSKRSSVGPSRDVGEMAEQLGRTSVPCPVSSALAAWTGSLPLERSAFPRSLA